jgi:ribonuclease HII
VQKSQVTHSQLTQYETELFRKGITHIAGIDEVGRGALAGPMVSAAVILNIPKMIELGVIVDPGTRNNDVSSPEIPAEIPPEKAWYLEINDSKKVSPKKRERLSALILENAIAYTFEVIDNSEVDEWGISKATQVSFFNSIKHLNCNSPTYTYRFF